MSCINGCETNAWFAVLSPFEVLKKMFKYIGMLEPAIETNLAVLWTIEWCLKIVKSQDLAASKC